ncbi:MRP-L47-domain-containing protein [Microthyrium microscopicum]|uniref:Large ribosomal subunit protein uL29m n=1 Tax=Microthyrium microscopicum TaxID=703497 RepID=A0A6A6UGG9_9PEZI|nr:MRP-L47-domain-containing protein [Microthyrium microscopicum]
MPPRISSTLSSSLPKTTSRITALASSSSQWRPQLHQSHNPRSFTTTPSPNYREKTARGNKLRGMSAIRGTGVAPWIKLSVTHDDLKTPRAITPVYPKNTSHGLNKFFAVNLATGEPELLSIPHEENKHGRAWTVDELRHKSFDDIHTLWWKCLHEKNRIYTEIATRKEVRGGYGETESLERVRVVKLTMRRIKLTLKERYTGWQEARKVAATDPSIFVDEEDMYRYDAELDEELADAAEMEEMELEGDVGLLAEPVEPKRREA